MEIQHRQPNQDRQLRKRIRDIQNDPCKNPHEKARLVQGLMHKVTTCISAHPENDFSPTCSHYDKKCSQFFFECCNVVDPCHRCHLARGKCSLRPARVTSVMCNECGTHQEPAQDCINCSTRMGRSYCEVCKIWSPLDIYHCNDCGFCRVGKVDEVFHCHTCDACFGIEGRDQHRCAKIQLKDACCPLCLESVHSAQKPSSILSCGHVLHADCWREAASKGEFRCPTCRKSLFEMKSFWDSIRRSIALQPIPKKFFPIKIGDVVDSPYGKFLVIEKRNIVDSSTGTFKTLCEGYIQEWTLANGSFPKATLDEDVLDNHKIVKICCFDCEQKTTTKFHFLGLECQACNGYNTSQI